MMASSLGRRLLLGPSTSLLHQSSSSSSSSSLFYFLSIRSKHSESAKRRIFGSRKHYEQVIKPAKQAAAEAPLQPLKYQPTYTPERWLPNGWSPPPPPGTPALPKESLPFQVERTQTGQWLPVYTDVRKGRTQLVTMVRKVSGDLEEMRSEMSKVCHGTDVLIRTGPRLEVKGRYTRQVRQWLAGLGF